MRESSIIDLYNKEQLEELVNNNKSYSDILTKMGYLRKGASAANRLRTRLDLLGIDYSHLDNDVTKYNTKIETVPTNLIASMFGMKKADLFQIEEYKRTNMDIGSELN